MTKLLPANQEMLGSLDLRFSQRCDYEALYLLGCDDV
jgi:hypothetical protein